MEHDGDHDLHGTLAPSDVDAVGVGDPDVEEPPFERPVDRFRATAVGSIVAAGLFGLAEVLEGRPPREEVAIVQEAPTRPVETPRRMELLLDPEHPERSMVFLPDLGDPGTP